jgi:signal transduction histidine kinase/CheY-like chemotaxis protein/HPt (histidine-containing phosphotransfer) domain-containing protein
MSSSYPNYIFRRLYSGKEYGMHWATGYFFTSLTMVTVILISIYSGGSFGLGLGLALTLTEDYFFIAPAGSIFGTTESLERFAVICVLTLVISFLGSSIRIGFNRAILEKENSDRATREADSANKFKTEFLSKMSHEIRTPINGIVGTIDLLKKTGLNEHQLHYLDNLRVSSNLLLSLINDILDLSKVEAGQLQLESIAFDINQMIMEVTGLYQPLAEQRGLKFTSRLETNSTGFFWGDPTRIRQVLTNFIGNALKFTKDGEISFNVRVLDPDMAGISKITFSVTDSGIGIPKKIQEHLFQRFSQADSSTARKYGGSGLGLAICRQLVDLMGGSLGVESQAGKGATFWFSVGLRVSYANDSKSPRMQTSNVSDSADPVTAQNGQLKSRILLAEDNDINLEITRTMLESAGFEVDSVANGHEVLAAVERTPYSLILMDCQMPDMDGYDAAKSLRERGVEIPIVALTANAFAQDRERCIKSGMSDYLPKPINENTLIQMVNKCLGEPFDSRSVLSASRNLDKSSDLSSSIQYEFIQRLEDLDGKAKTGLVAKLINQYIKTAPKTIQAIREAMASSNLQQLRHEAHKFKSGNGNLGLGRVVMILEALEDQNTPAANYPDLLTQLEADVDRAIEELRQYGLRPLPSIMRS